MAVAVGVPTDGGNIESGGPGGAAPTFAAKGNRSSSEGIPTGVWRDNLCDCCKFGPCHPHFLNAWLCRPLLMGQILTRMKMTWLGQRTPTTGSINDSRTDVDELWRNTFRNLVVLTVVFYLLMSMTSTPQTMDPTMPSLSGFNATTAIDGSSGQPHIITYDEMSASDKVKYTLNGWISTFFFVYTMYILIQLRATLRHVYSIPEESCLCMYSLGLCGNNPRDGICGNSSSSGSVPIGWEDVCCSFWCPMCVTAQMARHTVDYDERRGVCFNSVGVEGWDDDEAYAGVEGGVGEGSVLVV
jgi:hypothetical protein